MTGWLMLGRWEELQVRKTISMGGGEKEQKA